jgi:prolyl-tRNA editing enzyme YbaK/EbsC (Cys-tRNA(Pro) deacylase)
MSTPTTPAPPDPAAEAAERVAQHPAVVRVRTTLEGLGATGTITVLDEHARTAAQAAEQLGVEVGAIASSLVFAVPDEGAGRRAVLVLTSGAHRVNTERLADRLGLERLDRADPDFVRESTGFVIGGVAPVGHATPMETYIDITLAQFEQVWAAAGHPKTVFPTHYDELLRITAGHPIEVT